jgi:hypothetical protein
MKVMKNTEESIKRTGNCKFGMLFVINKAVKKSLSNHGLIVIFTLK